MAKITIHRALSELKVIDSKIAKAVHSIDPVGIKQNNKDVNGKYPEAKFIENAKSSYQSILDMITRKTVIKNAIVLSNAKTSVTVANKVMTVADAITAKSYAETKQIFIDNLKAKSRTARTNLERRNAEVDVKKENFITASLGGDKGKAKPEEVQALGKMFEENNMYSLVDPLDIETKIETLDSELQEFLGEVDAVLSETNATTFIEV